MKKCSLIFGITGQDGLYLSQYLLNKGHKVIGVSRNLDVVSTSNLKIFGIIDKITLIAMDVLDLAGVCKLIESNLPDEIYNLSGNSSVSLSISDPRSTFEGVTLGVINILEAVRTSQREIKFFNASSRECFGQTNGEPATLNSSFYPRSPYAVSKVGAFYIVKLYRELYDIYAVSGILFNHESPLRKQNFVTKKIVSSALRIKSGADEVLELGNLSIRRDWGWAPEYVEAMYLMLNMKTPNDHIIATGHVQSLKQLTMQIFNELDLDWSKYVKHQSVLERKNDPEEISGDTELARNELGWEAKCKGDLLANKLVEEEISYNCLRNHMASDL